MNTRRTTCALCESRCGLLADVSGDRVLGLRPDANHPVSQGHACVKGLHFHDVHHHADRVRRPRVDGSEVDWVRAFDLLGARLRRVVEEHGPDAVGLFSGNAAGHSLGAVLGVAAFQRGLGTHRHYSCLTLDNSPQFVVYEEVFGAAMRTFAADYGRSDAILLIGTDPLSSQCSQAQSNPRGVHHLREAGRQGRLWVADPRASRTARVGRHLAVRPGSDVPLLGWLLREALAEDRERPPMRQGDLGALREGLDGFDLQRVTEATGVPPAELEALRTGLLAARRPLVWSGLGVLLGGHGTVGFWLTLCLQVALGGLDREGGWRRPVGFDLAPTARRLGLRGRDPSVRGRSGHPAILDTLPAADLSADILGGDLKALVVVGGNPVLSLPHHGRAVEALGQLDTLICLDLVVNDTGSLAHAVLPVRSFLAREDHPLHRAGQRWAGGAAVLPEAEPAVVGPVGESRTDLHILVALCRAAGRPPFGSRLADLALRAGVDPVAVAGRLAPWLGGPGPLSFHPGGELRLAVPELLAALVEVGEPEPGLRLITSVRPVETLNHWMHGSRAALRREPVASVHPDTLAASGLDEGPAVLVGPDGARLRVSVRADPGTHRDAVVLPFGWGHLDGAVHVGGVNPNRLVRDDRLERFTGQPCSNGTPVRLAPADVG